jgi:hypothetical protein
MSSLLDHAAPVVLRLMRKRHLSVPHFGMESVPGRMPEPAKQREVRFSDFEQVASLKERGGLGKDSLANWRRLWKDNPALALAKSPLSMGWVLETAQGIVGYQGSIPLLYQIGTRALIAAAGTSLVVEPAYRARSIGLLGSFYRQPSVDLLLITTAVASVGELSKALQAKILPQQNYDTVLFWVLDADQFAKALVKKLRVNGKRARIASIFGSLALKTDQRIRARLPIHPPDGAQVSQIEVKDIGYDFEALWRRKLAEKPRLLADRSPTSLKWHFAVPGSFSNAVVLCCHKQERLIGYAVLRHAIDHETGMRRSLLADILVEQDDPNVTETLVAEAYSSALRSGHHVFEVLGLPPHVRQILMRWNPYVRMYPACPFFYKTNEENLVRILADEDAWYAGPFDGDTTLMP